MRITVIGPGAVGLFFASRLCLSGQEVNILDHNAERAAELNCKGIFFKDNSTEQRFFPEISSDPKIIEFCDLALICVKAYDTMAVAEILGKHLNTKARVLTLQNGVGNLETLVRFVDAKRVLGGTTSEGATLLEPGVVKHGGKGVTLFGRTKGKVDDFTSNLAEILGKAGLSVKTSERVQDLVWTKLVINVGINALTALYQVPNGRLLEMSSALVLMRQAVEEACLVGQKLKVAFLYEDMFEKVKQVAYATANNLSSMLQDVRNRKRTEVQFINGAIDRYARNLSISAPVNRSLAQLVLSLESQNRT